MGAIPIARRAGDRRCGGIPVRRDHRLDGGKPRVGHFVVAGLVGVEAVRHVGQRHHGPHVEKRHPPARRRMGVHAGLHEWIEEILNVRVVGFAALHQVGDDDVRVGPQRGDFENQRVEPVDRGGDGGAAAEIIRPDVHQDHVRVGHVGQPARDVGIDLIDSPAAVALVVRVGDQCAVVIQRADVIHVVTRARQLVVEAQAVAATAIGTVIRRAVGDRIPQRHDPDGGSLG